MRLSSWPLLLGITVGCLACDQETKHLAEVGLAHRPPIDLLHHSVRLMLANNPGAWGSLGAAWPAPLRVIAFALLPLAVLGLLVAQVLRRHDATRTQLVALALVLGGGLGNVVDRLLRGSVRDFMIVGRAPLVTNVFNVADVAVLLGMALLLLGYSTARKPTVGIT